MTLEKKNKTKQKNPYITQQKQIDCTTVDFSQTASARPINVSFFLFFFFFSDKSLSDYRASLNATKV